MLFGMKVCLLVALVVAPAATTPFPKNYEYSATKIDRFPHHASVRSIVDTKHYCSAAIISERWLLSSAQCTQGEHDVAGNIFIVVGVTSVNKDGDRYNIAEIINHPEYEITKKKRANDIAMLKTVENIRMKLSGVHPISLPSYKSHYLIENPIGLIPATVTGWSEYKQVGVFVSCSDKQISRFSGFFYIFSRFFGFFLYFFAIFRYFSILFHFFIFSTKK